ncbi:MAG: BrnA antitoxin family protein [Gemmatimonadaceae bacterium]
MRNEYDFSKARRGPVVAVAPGKTRITIRVDDDVLDWFRAQVHDAGGGNYQTLINQTLRSVMEQAREPLERVLRRVVREELTRDGARPRRRNRAGAV